MPSSATPPSSTTHRVGIALTMADIDHYEKTGEYPSAMNAWAFRYAISEMARVAFARSEIAGSDSHASRLNDLLEAARVAEIKLRDGGTYPIKGETWRGLRDALLPYKGIASSSWLSASATNNTVSPIPNAAASEVTQARPGSPGDENAAAAGVEPARGGRFDSCSDRQLSQSDKPREEITVADIEEFRKEHAMHELPGDEPWVAKHNRILNYLCYRACTPLSSVAGLQPHDPEEVREWISHLDLHLTEHDLQHAGKALRAAWPHVKKFLDGVLNERATWKELAETRLSATAESDKARLDWLFSRLNDTDIKAKIDLVANAYCMGGLTGIRRDAFRDAIDQAMKRSEYVPEGK